MIYKIKAQFRREKAAEYLQKLTDGTIAGQKPDGKEIVASMGRARVIEDGSVCWSETCFCATPLAHERQTVLDKYFTDMETEKVDEYMLFDGEPFMDLLVKTGKNSG